MGLLGDIQDGATEDSVSLAALLRKVELLAARLGVKEIGEWAERKLSGYNGIEGLPLYQGPFEVWVVGDVQGPFGSGYKNLPFPKTALAEQYRDSQLFKLCFTQGVAELESLAAAWRKLLFTDAQIDDYLMLKHELPNFECKGSGKQSDNPLFGKVIRSALGMANRPDGGIVIIGVAEVDHVLSPDGLTDEQLETWRYDDIADGFNAYTEPHILFEYQPCEWNGRKFLILHIHEFTDVPVICKKDYRDDSNSALSFERREKVLRKGLIYARSLNKAETKEIDSVERMRAVLDLAIRKGIQKFVEQTQEAGLSFTNDVRSRNAELFREQRERWKNPLITEIQMRGSWELVIRPESFVQERIDFSQLYPLIRDSAINLRSHSFPFILLQPTHGEDWISEEFSQSWVIEAWRLYQSGQFVYLGGILDDWRDRMNFPLTEGWKSGMTLTIEEVVYRCTEFFEFASRLALADGYHLNGKVDIQILVTGLNGRVLSVDRSNRLPIPRGSATAADHVSYRREFTPGELVAYPKKLALQAATEVFNRFNWYPSEDYLQGIQSDIG